MLMNILAIETSCDDTSVAIVTDGSIILSSIVATQLEHSAYGGVVPEVAAREHIKHIIPVLEEAFRVAEVTWDEIDAIAVTEGPGLIGSLIVGVNTAKTLAYIYNKPLIAVHHTEGHIYANWLKKNLPEVPTFPLVCLTASGGHTNVIYMAKHLNYKIIGETQDDAAGEAYDKVAKMLDLGYPGGPEISKMALLGNKEAYRLPITDLTSAPKRNEEGFLVNPKESLDFSYSGLKTAVLNLIKRVKADNESLTIKQKEDISASFEFTANKIMSRNLARAVKEYKPKTVLLSGGVAANTNLRKQVIEELGDYKVNIFIPDIKCCTDNAAMIAAAAYQHSLIDDYCDAKSLVPDPNLKLI